MGQDAPLVASAKEAAAYGTNKVGQGFNWLTDGLKSAEDKTEESIGSTPTHVLEFGALFAGAYALINSPVKAGIGLAILAVGLSALTHHWDNSNGEITPANAASYASSYSRSERGANVRNPTLEMNEAANPQLPPPSLGAPAALPPPPMPVENPFSALNPPAPAG